MLATRSAWLINAATRIIALPRLVKFLTAITLDVLTLVVATSAVGWIIYPQMFADHAGLLMVSTAAVVTPVLYFSGAYAAVVRFASAYTVLRLARAVVTGYLVLALAAFALGDLPQVWKLLVLAPFAAGFLLSAWRLLAAMILKPRIGRSAAKPVLIYGAGNAGVQLASALMSNMHYRPVGFVDDRADFRGRLIFGLKVYARADLRALKEALVFERVLLAMPSAPRNRRKEILQQLEQLAIKVMVMPALDELVSGERQVDDLREVQIEDLLGRDPVAPNQGLMDLYIRDKVVMVTGAGGSIGSELCRQALRSGARKLVMFEMSEFALYCIERELRPVAEAYGCELTPVLGNVCKQRHMARVLSDHAVETIYHAAAYKHVPLVEQNVVSAVQNNVFATLSVARAAIDCKVENFVLISSDKAVRPPGVMGKSKRVCELVIQALASQETSMRMSLVRFGNVLASSGSVVPLFREQIRRGGPVTVTHPDVTRYFMTIPEAAQLVIQAGAMGGKGEVFVLDMGEPVRILDLAERMIRLSGLTPRCAEQPAGDIEIRFSGLRSGEKLYEELLIGNSPKATQHQRIFLAHEHYVSWKTMSEWLSNLQLAIDRDDKDQVAELLSRLIEVPAVIEPQAGSRQTGETAAENTAAQAFRKRSMAATFAAPDGAAVGFSASAISPASAASTQIL